MISKDEIKRGIIYIVLFLLLKTVGIRILANVQWEFISENLTACFYGILFVCAMALFGKLLVKAVRDINKEMLAQTFVGGMLIFLCVVFVGVALSFTGITNQNEEAIINLLETKPIISMISVVVLAPIVEELLYRFCVFGFIERINIYLAHAVVALIFGFVHVDSYVMVLGDYMQLVHMLYYSVMSLGLSIMYKRTKNICSPMLIHMGINLLASIS